MDSPAHASPSIPAPLAWIGNRWRGHGIRRRVWLPPIVAGVALGVVLVLTVALGVANQRRLGRLERGHYPSLQASRTMLTLVDQLREDFEAAALSDPDRLAAADSGAFAFTRALRGARAAQGADTEALDSVAAAYDAYDTAARVATGLRLRGAHGGATEAAVARMEARHARLRGALVERRDRDQAAVEHAFAGARRLHTATWTTIAIITVGCVCVLGVIAFRTVRSVVPPLERAAAAADRIAAGDTAASLPEGSDDEIGRLLGALRHMLAAVHDSARDLRQSEARFRALVQESSDLILVLDAGAHVRDASPALERQYGHTRADVSGAPLAALLHDDDREATAAALAALAAHPGGSATLRHRLRRADGSWRHVESVGTNLLHEEAVRGVVLNVRDVTERTELEAQLVHQAFHDPLTGLANRALFRDRVSQALLRRARGDDLPLAVLLLDLDEFKRVNDVLGHAAGDALLVTVARRLLIATRGCDTVARLGGDEFAVLITNLKGAEDVTIVADRILDAVRGPVLLDAGEVRVRASIGIAHAVPDVDAEELLRHADAAMYAAKGDGKGRHAQFAPERHAATLDRIALEEDLARAVERGELRLLFQPIVDLATGNTVGAEALVRWQHPTRGLVPPVAFIPLAESTELIVPIGRWVLEEACRAAAQWRSRVRGRGAYVTVNVSTRQLLDATFPDDVARALGGSGLAAKALTLEITESTFLQRTDEVVERLHALRALGVRLAIDDFGTGYSSLAYLQRLPVDVLKIDKSFVDALGTVGPGAALARTIVALGETLALCTVAEGIETADQLVRLRELGCALGQGYLFARPLELAAFEERLGKGRRGAKGARLPALGAGQGA